MTTYLKRVEAHGLELPIPASWVSHGVGLYVGPDGRMDARLIVDGTMVDLARTTEAAETMEVIQCGLVNADGFPAMWAIGRSDGWWMVHYIVADTPEFGNDVCWPERRVIYAFDDGARDVAHRILKDLLKRSQDIQGLATHPLTVEGHLEFAPILVPASWRLVAQDGGAVELGACVGPYRELGVGGGFLRLSGDATTPGGLNFGPIPFEHRLLAELSAVSSRAVARASGYIPNVGLASVDVVKMPFVNAPVVRVSLRLPKQPTMVGLVYVWNDAIGYAWELGLTIAEEESPKLESAMRDCRLGEQGAIFC